MKDLHTSRDSPEAVWTRRHGITLSNASIVNSIQNKIFSPAHTMRLSVCACEQADALANPDLVETTVNSTHISKGFTRRWPM
ncbi:hypothetical protein M404DRAFT_994485 [Pisolithus tinctorius Marx 270]|uniref:Uncharacterized protein n=1 Tax=Pisolithus tinctorius Marx 270 TaxID=870435 RepID=A0A0C3KQE4_PISTI|nr:hypothetical protein M404DRAFT_994485 [Pisolithus tinctorius Marx 270]